MTVEPRGRVALGETEIQQTAAAIEVVQQDSGAIPWFTGGHTDPWDHVEGAMALTAAGRVAAARAAYDWLEKTQRIDGSWPAKFVGDDPVDHTIDANFCAYVAAGIWHHWLATRDELFIRRKWPVVERAIDFTLRLQAAGGEILWARDRSYVPWPGALLTSSSCVHLSLRCAVALAETLGEKRPDWELGLLALGDAIRSRPGAFEPKDRYSMDWYYPILSGALSEPAALVRIDDRWQSFVIDGVGVRCVSDRPWVTTAETCELVLALDSIGLTDEATTLFEWIQVLREPDGAYWTGMTWPDRVVWPRERTTWSSAAVVLAWDALCGASPAAHLFRSAGWPEPSELSDPVADAL